MKTCIVALPKDSVPSVGLIVAGRGYEIASMPHISNEDLFKMFEDNFKKISQEKLREILPEDKKNFITLYLNWDFYITEATEENFALASVISDLVLEENPTPPTMFVLLAFEVSCWEGPRPIGVCKYEKIAKKACADLSTADYLVTYKEVPRIWEGE